MGEFTVQMSKTTETYGRKLNRYSLISNSSLQQNVTTVTNFSEEKFFVTKNLHLATKSEFRHKK